MDAVPRGTVPNPRDAVTLGMLLPGAEEVVDMRGAGLTQTYFWFGKVRPNEEKKKGRNQLTITFHLTSYAFIANKLP